jgi:hypothetical protein
MAYLLLKNQAGHFSNQVAVPRRERHANDCKTIPLPVSGNKPILAMKHCLPAFPEAGHQNMKFAIDFRSQLGKLQFLYDRDQTRIVIFSSFDCSLMDITW